MQPNLVGPMAKSDLFGALLAVVAAGWVSTAAADDTPVIQSPPVGSTPRGVVMTPGSSISKPEDLGTRAHTNTKVFVLTPRSSPSPK